MSLKERMNLWIVFRTTVYIICLSRTPARNTVFWFGDSSFNFGGEWHWVKESTGGTLACITSTGFFTWEKIWNYMLVRASVTRLFAQNSSTMEFSESYDHGIWNIRSVFVTNWNDILASSSDNSRTYFLVTITIELWLCYFAITIEFNNGGWAIDCPVLKLAR